MTKRARILAIACGALAGLLIVATVAAVIIVQTPWFSNFAKNRILAAAEESTGGIAQAGSFEFDLSHLTIRMRNVVLHGTEPKGADPLLRIALLELRLKLFSGIAHVLDLNYLGVQQPRVNVILFPNGTTNIPQPKIPPTVNSLETVVDLKVNKFEVENGLIRVAQQTTAFSGRGENLQALLEFDNPTATYRGDLSMKPVLLASGNRPPLDLSVNIPIQITSTALTVANARLTTPQSQVSVDASLKNGNAPIVTMRLNANIWLPEIQRSIAIPVNANAAGAPKTLTAQLAARIDESTNAVQIQSANLALGQTTLQASGSAGPKSNSSIQFDANLALAELAKLMDVTSVRLAGDLQANGNATLDAQNNYAVNGTVNSKGLSIIRGTTQLSNLSLSGPFHFDPHLISMNWLKLNALGGSVAAKIFIENMARLSIEGNVRNFSLPVLVSTLMGKRLGYDGTIDGSLTAKGDMQAKGARGYTAQVNLNIAPGRHGVPVSGRLYARYSGSSGAVDLGQSYLSLPHSRLDLSGSLNQRIDLNLVSHNLNDFLPAVNFESATPQRSFPITLQRGTAAVTAQVTGNLSNPHVTARMAMSDFAVSQHSFDRLGLELAASSTGALMQNGLLTGRGLQTNFDGSIGLAKWKLVAQSPVTANLSMRSADIADLLSLAGESSVEGSGQLAADAHIHGTYGDPLGNATLQITGGSAYNQPFSRLYANINLSDQLIAFSNVELDTAGGKVTLNGTYRHPSDSLMVGQAQFHTAAQHVQLADVRPLQEKGAVGALVQLAADARINVSKSGEKTQVTPSNISADASATGIRVQNQAAGDVTATARTTNGSVHYKLASNFAGSNVRVDGQTGLTGGYPTVAEVSIQSLSVSKTLELVGQTSIPASGTLSANAHVSGTIAAPNADLSFTLAHATLYGEPVNTMQGRAQYSNTLVNIPSLRLDIPAGSLSLSGSLSHPTNDFNNGTLALKVNSTPIQVGKIEHVEILEPGVAGTLQMAAELSGKLRERNGSTSVLLSSVSADATLKGVTMNATSLGNATLSAHTSGSTLNFRLDSDLAKSQIHGSGQAQLTENYPMRARLNFAHLKYSNLAPLLSTTSEGEPLRFDATAEGQITVDGPVLKPDDLSGRLQLNHFDMETTPRRSPTGAPAMRQVMLQNQGPMILELKRSLVQVQQLHITGPGTTLSASGGINLRNANAPLGLVVAGNLDLGVLQDISHDFYSSGAVTLNATLHGSFSQPLVNGRIELKNANVNYIGFPNGLSNGNGVILLNGTNASIQNLTGGSGGGKVSASGYIGYANGGLSYNLKATANKVRVLYSGLGIVSNANLSLVGSSRRARLGGTVSVTRIAYTSSSDAGSLLSRASSPPSSPAPSLMLSNLHLDVHILTAPDVRVVSTYTRSMDVLASLTLRGTAQTPGILGYINITNGQLVFFGNTYSVDNGTINFYNPNAIEPVVNISLQTIVQGVSVVIGVSGPMDDLKLSYRSDPPLTFEQIVELLATNTTPSNPEIAAQQPPVAQESLNQMGESALLGQAVADPLASRLQRVFGLTELKIDPSFSGSNGQPGARVTLRQKITSNITFTYITDVSQTNGQILRVDWDLTPKLSAVGLRDFNGNVSVEMVYKFSKR